MNPIVGTRYSLRGEEYDLCQAEFDKLPPEEQGLYDAILPPDDLYFAVERLFELLDADRSGTVEMREFYGAMRKNREVIALAMRFSALRELVPKRSVCFE